jgi:hypothetical protein
MVGGRGDVHIIRVYLPPATNTLLSVAGHCLRSRQYVNVIVAGKQPALTYLTMDEAILHCTRGLGIWPWASNTDGEPDVVLACAGMSRRWRRSPRNCSAPTCRMSRCASSMWLASCGWSRHRRTRTSGLPVTGCPSAVARTHMRRAACCEPPVWGMRVSPAGASMNVGPVSRRADWIRLLARDAP